MAAIRAMVVEDQRPILKSLERLLEASGEVEVVGTARDGAAAIREAVHLKPDVILLDLGLPRVDGIEVTRQVKEQVPETEVLIYTVFDEEDRVLEAIQAGAAGYMLKGTPLERVLQALKDILGGGSVIQPTLARRLLHRFKEAQEEEADRPVPLQPLSKRETEVLELIAKGLSNSEAACTAGISRATIRTHLEHIYAKLDVTNRVEAVTEAIRMGIIKI